MIGFGVSTDPRSSWGESKKGFQGSKGEAEASLGRAFFKKKTPGRDFVNRSFVVSVES